MVAAAVEAGDRGVRRAENLLELFDDLRHAEDAEELEDAHDAEHAVEVRQRRCAVVVDADGVRGGGHALNEEGERHGGDQVEPEPSAEISAGDPLRRKLLASVLGVRREEVEGDVDEEQDVDRQVDDEELELRGLQMEGWMR